MPRLKGKDQIIGRQWKKGQSGNPKGRPHIPADLKLIKELEKEELTKTFSELLKSSKEELTSILADQSSTALQHGIARGLRHFMSFGDFRYVQPYLAYIFGYPKQHAELTGKNGTPLMPAHADLSKIPVEDLKKFVEEKI